MYACMCVKYVYIYVRETFMFYVTLLFLEGRVSKVSKSTG